MDKIISQTTYWTSFYKNNPDPEPFREFIATDSILTKIFNIVAIPDIISTFDAYPFDKKQSEFSSISRDEIQHLYDLRITKGFEKDLKVVEYLDWLVAVYELVKVTISYYQDLKNHGYSGEELIENTALGFCEQFSIDEEIVYENSKSERYKAHFIGRKFPNMMLKILELPGEVTIAQLLFRLRPTKEILKYFKNNFDAGSVIQFGKFRPHADEITYGGFDPTLDQTGLYHSNQNLKTDIKKSQKFIVEFYYRGKKIDEFNYSIRDRYKNLVLKAAKNIEEPEIRDDNLRLAEAELLRLVENFKESEGKPPAVYFSASLEYIGKNIFKSESTEAVPKEFGEIKRISKTKLEHSGGSVEEEIPDEDKDEYSNQKTKTDEPKASINISLTIENKDYLKKIRKKICKDEIDKKILELLLDGIGRFENSDEINFTAIARALGTYDKDISRRWEMIQDKARKIRSKENLK